jgi:hypothetical protein
MLCHGDLKNPQHSFLGMVFKTRVAAATET